MNDLKLTKRGQIVFSALFTILAFAAIFLAASFVNSISTDKKVGSDQIHISCVDGATKLSDGTCMIKE